MRVPVIPVIRIDDTDRAGALAEALVAGGLPVLEVTLRTTEALQAIEAMAVVEGAIVGAGTLVTPEDARLAKRAGARFGVSPGVTEMLLATCEEENLPLLPGAATASEMMRLLARGYDMLKFFPAEASGGVAALRALGGPLPQVSFCPTGGISLANAGDYLALPNVHCVGGSWLVPSDALEREDWAHIENLAREASLLRDWSAAGSPGPENGDCP